MRAARAASWVGRSLWDGAEHDPADPLDDRTRGCARAAAAGVGAPVVPTRTGPPPPRPGARSPAGLGAMWRWAEQLVPVGEPASLGEGGTPLVALPSVLGRVPGRVLVKDERANPTGSFKDRLAAATVSRARHLGATTVAAASSGNAGLAVAAAAAAAGLRAVVLVTGAPPVPTAAELAASGALVLAVERPEDRWRALRTGVDELGWFPVTNHSDPPVASHPTGVHAYRTIAYEIAEALDWRVPDQVVLPVSRGDGLFGVWAGFAEMARLGWTDAVPRMVAVERHPSLGRALAAGDAVPRPVVDAPTDPAVSRSIGDRCATVMALETLRRSRGLAVAVDDDDLCEAAATLARAGLVVETSAAAVLPGLRRLIADGRHAADDTTVLVATAGARAQATLPPPPPPVPLRDPTDAAALRDLTTDERTRP